MTYRIFTLFTLFTSLTAYGQSDQFVVSMGTGIANTGSSVKTVSAGIQEDLWLALKDRAIIGAWIDNNSERSDSLFAAGQLGFEVDNRGFLAGIFSGPGLISNTDARLGSYLEFISDAHFGIQDQNSNYVGVMLRHISNAGISDMNSGRDMVLLELRF